MENPTSAIVQAAAVHDALKQNTTNREGWSKEEDALLTHLVNSNTMTWYAYVIVATNVPFSSFSISPTFRSLQQETNIRSDNIALDETVQRALAPCTRP
jgi:hypothetical protein